jgi:PhzF family phenazine biosynthesis protein
MKMKLFQVDAFASRIFSGNPAAICPLDKWLDDETLQNIAMENNLAETGYFVRNGKQFDIRWFTPTVEVDLCGHATLAAAHVIFNHLNFAESRIEFMSHRSGPLSVFKNNEFLTLDFPTDTVEQVPLTQELKTPFNNVPKEAYRGKTDYMLVFNSEEKIISLSPDMKAVNEIPECRGVIVTAPGNDVDFVSRFFAPQSGIDEDPVTGSAHTTLIPYWSKVLGKTEMTAMQLSNRKGFLKCKHLAERVHISGQAKTYLVGEIEIGY